VNQDDEVGWPLELTSEEKRLGVAGLMKRYVDPVLKEMGDAARTDWPPERLKKYEQMTMAEFLRMQGASAGAIELFRMGYLEINGDGIDSYSALSGLRDLVLGHAEKEYQIKGGSDLLPKALAAQLADKIIYGSPVVRIEHHEKGVRVIFLQAGAQQTLVADHLICATPFSTLKLVDVSPRFSPVKQKAIERLSYTSVTRVYLQLRRKFWQAEGLSGEAYIDNPRMLLAPLGHVGKRDIYESFITGSSARQVMSLGERQRLNYVLEQARKVLPAVRENFEGGASKSWDEDEWARGAWAWYRPGEMTSLLPHISRSEGRVHFAGEHTSAWPGWMQGAFESGNRVAKEVHAA
jgi:monoamine oxidase